MKVMHMLSHVIDLWFVYSGVFSITRIIGRHLMTHPASTLFTCPADCTWQRLNISQEKAGIHPSITNGLVLHTTF
jgi:hypothetical protein